MEEKVVIIIPAKLGSVRVLEKNIRLLCGRPMLNYVHDAAWGSRITEHVFVATEDDIVKQALDRSAKFFDLPAKIAREPYQVVDVALYCLEELSELDYTTLILLQPDCPFTWTLDLLKAYELFLLGGRRPVQSVVKTEPGCSPLFSYKLRVEKRELIPACVAISRVNHFASIKVPKTYMDTGNIFIVDIKELQEKRTRYIDGMIPYVMPLERSWEIDNEFQFRVAECLMRKKSKCLDDDDDPDLDDWIEEER